jgi:hypothetical protein
MEIYQDAGDVIKAVFRERFTASDVFTGEEQSSILQNGKLVQITAKENRRKEITKSRMNEAGDSSQTDRQKTQITLNSNDKGDMATDPTDVKNAKRP